MLYFLAYEKVTAKIYIVYEGIEDIFPFVLNTKLPMAKYIDSILGNYKDNTEKAITTANTSMGFDPKAIQSC